MGNSKLKIAIYSGNIPSTTFIENLIEGLSEEGYEIYLFGKQTKKVIYRGNVKLFPTPSSNIKLILFDLKEFLILFFKNPKLFFKSLRLIWNKKKNLITFIKDAGIVLPILNHKPNIFHVQWAKAVHKFPELFELLNCKIALSLRGAHINYSPLADTKLAESYRKYFPVIESFHAVSEAIGIESLKYGALRNKIKVIHSSIKEEMLEKTSDLHLKGQTLKIISIGRHHWKKGYHYALDAMKFLKDGGVPFCYSIITQDNISEEILFMVNDYELQDEVKFIQELSYDRVIVKLRHSHILLLSSVEEGIANVVLEAMAVGVPVITTNCGGMDEVVDDGLNGYKVSVRSPREIAEKIFEFINTNQEIKIEIAKKAKEKIKKDFSREKQIKDFSDFYHSLVKA